MWISSNISKKRKKKILRIHFHIIVDYTSIISNVSYRCISRAMVCICSSVKIPLKIERTKQPGQWTTGKFSTVTRINKTTVKIYREAGSNTRIRFHSRLENSRSDRFFTEGGRGMKGGLGGNLLGAESLARYADTSSRNHFRLSEKPSVIKMTPADKSNPTEEEK